MKPSPAPDFDFLIVGQGLAGTLLAHFLIAENQRVALIDSVLPGATSHIAAGVINPVTGRRMAKSWRYEELFLFAKKTYQTLEETLGQPLWQERNILRALPNIFEENEWSRRGLWPDHAPYFCEAADLGNYAGKLTSVLAWGEMKGAAKVDLPGLAAASRHYFLEKNLLIEAVFDFGKLEVLPQGLRYNGQSAWKIIFCEGGRGAQNPYFCYLPFVPTKGELLLVRIPGSSFEKLLKNHLFIVPIKGDLCWVGSTSRFEFEGPGPTPANLDFLENELRRILAVPFQVVEHQAGIRPTVADKRPLLGAHPKHQQLCIFNGLGTKGASLGPFFASQMAGFLLGKNELEREVDIRRFLNI